MFCVSVVPQTYIVLFPTRGRLYEFNSIRLFVLSVVVVHVVIFVVRALEECVRHNVVLIYSNRHAQALSMMRRTTGATIIDEPNAVSFSVPVENVDFCTQMNLLKEAKIVDVFSATPDVVSYRWIPQGREKLRVAYCLTDPGCVSAARTGAPLSRMSTFEMITAVKDTGWTLAVWSKEAKRVFGGSI